jgi:predicted RNA-binding protein (virulence factor B family)
MDWEWKRHLVPFKEQASMEKGKRYLVYLYMDEKTGWLPQARRINFS